MKCPHCHSVMYIQEQNQTERSKVIFYRCTVCVAEHVSSAININHALHSPLSNIRFISTQTSA